MLWVRVPPEQLFFHFPWKRRCSGLLYCLALIYVCLTVSMHTQHKPSDSMHLNLVLQLHKNDVFFVIKLTEFFFGDYLFINLFI